MQTLQVIEENGKQKLKKTVKKAGKALLDRAFPQGERDFFTVMADEVVNTPGRLVEAIPDPGGFTPEERKRLMKAAAGYGGQSKTPEVPQENTLPSTKGLLINENLEKSALEAEERMGPVKSIATRLATPSKLAMPFGAFHGTPGGRFAKFDASKIGTGEGTQAYGYGLYFAERHGVSRHYAGLKRGYWPDDPNIISINNKDLDVEDLFTKIDIDNPHSYFKTNFNLDLTKEEAFYLKVRLSRAVKGDTTFFDEVLPKASEDYVMYLKKRLPKIPVDEQGVWKGMIAEQEKINSLSTKLKHVDLSIRSKERGLIKEVTIPWESDELLDWDKKLYQQSDKVLDKLFNAGYSPVDSKQIKRYNKLKKAHEENYDALHMHEWYEQQRLEALDDTVKLHPELKNAKPIDISRHSSYIKNINERLTNEKHLLKMPGYSEFLKLDAAIVDEFKPLLKDLKVYKEDVFDEFTAQHVIDELDDILDVRVNKFYNSLGKNDREASAKLAAADIPGHRFRDYTRNRGKEGTRNTVIYPGHEDKVRIDRITLERDYDKTLRNQPDRNAFDSSNPISDTIKKHGAVNYPSIEIRPVKTKGGGLSDKKDATQFDYVYNHDELPMDVRQSFDELASAQRGKPERAMHELQKVSGGGVLPEVVEHVGDINHRMNQFANRQSHSMGREYVINKAEKTHRWLTSKYGFKKEHAENLVENAKFSELDLTDLTNKVDEALKVYAKEHANLRVYNRPQWLAREAAVSVGNKEFDQAAKYLEELMELANDEKEYLKAVSTVRRADDGLLMEYTPPKSKRKLLK